MSQMGTNLGQLGLRNTRQVYTAFGIRVPIPYGCWVITDTVDLVRLDSVYNLPSLLLDLRIADRSICIFVCLQ